MKDRVVGACLACGPGLGVEAAATVRVKGRILDESCRVAREHPRFRAEAHDGKARPGGWRRFRRSGGELRCPVVARHRAHVTCCCLPGASSPNGRVAPKCGGNTPRSGAILGQGPSRVEKQAKDQVTWPYDDPECNDDSFGGRGRGPGRDARPSCRLWARLEMRPRQGRAKPGVTSTRPRSPAPSAASHCIDDAMMGAVITMDRCGRVRIPVQIRRLRPFRRHRPSCS